MALILVSNDDGIDARGIKVLKDAVSSLGRTIVFAPDGERSGYSHSLTIRKPIKVTRIEEDVYATDGTPTDCVLYSVRGILDKRPDVVVSGINQGANLGIDVSYSGTVAVALEGTCLEVPSIAFSQVRYRENIDFAFAKKTIKWITSRVLENGLPEGVFLNVNFPPEPNGKIKITKLGNRVYRDEIVKVDESGDDRYYTLGGEKPTFISEENSDFDAIDAGFTSITPIHMEYTDYEIMKEMKHWEEDY